MKNLLNSPWLKNAGARVLVLGHSTYGSSKTDPHNIKRWINDPKAAEDRTWDRFFRVATGKSSRKVDRATWKQFFSQFAFTNLVIVKMGKWNGKPTAQQYEEGKQWLRAVLDHVKPRAVSVFGYAHRAHSKKVLDEYNIPSVYAVHPVCDKKSMFARHWSDFEALVFN
jgi:uracil-DNA glycosylase